MSTETPKRSGGDILIVDDDPLVLKLLAEILTENSFQFRIANSGALALKSMETLLPGLVLLDIDMPDISGYELCRRMKTFPHLAAIPVIFVTGLVDEENKVQGFAVGGVDYITKPFQAQEVVARVRAHMSISRLQHHLEEMVEERTSNLNAERERFQRLFELASDAFFIHDLDGKIVDANRKACSSLGYSHAELLNLNVADLEVRTSHDQIVARFGQPKNGQHEFIASRHQRKDGSMFPVEISLGLFQEQDPQLMLAVARDVSERQKLERKLRQAEKMESIGQLAGGIAHDFNNILGGIVGYAELTLDELSGENILRDNLKQILRGCDRAKHLVQQILTFSRHSSESHTPVFLAPILGEAVKLLCATLPSSINITSEISDDTAAVLGNDTKIHELVINLCTNAAHAMDEKGNLQITLSQEVIDAPVDSAIGPFEPGPYYVIRVDDDGHGMSEDVLARIFEPFFTTKKSGSGTGLGLSVVFGVVQSHGGNITVDSKPGQGTTVKVFLPKTEKAPADRVSTVPAIEGGSERILIVDDEESLVRLLNTMLSRLGYQVTVFSSSTDALRAFVAHPESFDLVITDQTMPLLTGIELAEKLHQVRSSIPVILCTGYSKIVNEEKAQQAGIAAFMKKPINRKDLAATIRKVLAR